MFLRQIPRLIVFDLDHTLWPFGVDNYYFKPPYHKTNEKVFDSEKKLMQSFPEVTKILKQLDGNGSQLAVASRTTYPMGAHSLIDLFGWKPYIKYREIYPGSKLQHFSNLKLKSGFSYKQMLFFDDENRNIVDIKPLGVMAILVDSKVGVNLELIQQSLKQFQNISP